MTKSVLCIGATLIDELYFCNQTIVPHTSNPASKTSSIGGVVSNILQHLALLEVKVNCITALGTDAEGHFITEEFQKRGINLKDALFIEEATGKYVSILDTNGNLHVSVCQDISEKYLTPAFLETKSDSIQEADLIIIDTNLSSESLQWVIDFARKYQKELIIEPVSVPKAAKLAQLNLDGVFLISPNEAELSAIASIATMEETQLVKNLQERGVTNIWLSKGHKGSVLYNPTNTIKLNVPTINLVDSTGAGDAAVAGYVYGYVNGATELHSMQLGHALAFQVLQVKGAVDLQITPEKLIKVKKIHYHDS